MSHEHTKRFNEEHQVISLEASHCCCTKTFSPCTLYKFKPLGHVPPTPASIHIVQNPSLRYALVWEEQVLSAARPAEERAAYQKTDEVVRL